MTAPARHGIDPAVDSMAGYIVPPMRHAPVGVCLVFDRGLQLRPDPMTVIAEVGFMAHVTNFHLLSRDRTVVFHKQGGVDVAPVGDIVIGLIMAVRAVFEVFTLFFRMQQGRCPPLLRAGTGQNPSDNADE